jgi:hypothetical protein
LILRAKKSLLISRVAIVLLTVISALLSSFGDNPLQEKVLTMRGQYYALTAQDIEAVHDFDQVLRKSPKNVAVHLERAKSLLFAHSNRASIRAMLQDYHGAFEDSPAALKIDPSLRKARDTY